MNTPLILLDMESPLPPYEQITSQIRIHIASERLRAGDSLPSVRQLARDLQIAPNTVVRAYNELVQEGWITPSARRSFTVAKHSSTLIGEERTRLLQRAVDQLVRLTSQLHIAPEEVYAEIERRMHSSSL